MPSMTDTSYYAGKTTREMIQDVRRWLGVGADDSNRYSDNDVVHALNIGQERFVKLSGCLTYPAVVTLRANIQHYRLPYNALKIIAARYYFGSSATSYQELKILFSAKQMQRIDSMMRGTLGTPAYLFPSYRAGNILRFGISPIPSSNGSNFTGSEYGIVMTATGFETVGNITGQHHPSYPNNSYLVDSQGRNLLSMGVQVGYPVRNLTDGSIAVITSIGNVLATNDAAYGTLTGGTENDWDANDLFSVPMGEYGVVLDINQNEYYTFTTQYGTLLDIVPGAGNLILDIVRKPLALSAAYDQMYCEIPAAYHEAPIAFAVYWLARGAFRGVTQKEKAAEALQVFMNYVSEFDRPDELVEETDSLIDDRMTVIMDW